MYVAKITYDRIVHLSEKNKIPISKLNELCSISKDTLSASAKSKEGMKAKKLYDISEILKCSVDYLLGRTDNPNAHQQQDVNTISQSNVNSDNSSVTIHSPTPENDSLMQEFMSAFAELSFEKKVKAMDYVNKLKSK